VRRLFAAMVAALFATGLSPAAVAAPAPTATSAPAAVAKPVTLEALRGLIGVREPQISPDGSRVAFVRAAADYKADRTDTELDLVDVAGGPRRVLTRDRVGVHSPRWSPGGDRLAYLASRPGASRPSCTCYR